MIRPKAPPVPPRPSKTLVAEALAKSRKLSPVRVLYATQPLSSNINKEHDKHEVKSDVVKKEAENVKLISSNKALSEVKQNNIKINQQGRFDGKFNANITPLKLEPVKPSEEKCTGKISPIKTSSSIVSLTSNQKITEENSPPIRLLATNKLLTPSEFKPQPDGEKLNGKLSPIKIATTELNFPKKEPSPIRVVSSLVTAEPRVLEKPVKSQSYTGLKLNGKAPSPITVLSNNQPLSYISTDNQVINKPTISANESCTKRVSSPIKVITCNLNLNSSEEKINSKSPSPVKISPHNTTTEKPLSPIRLYSSLNSIEKNKSLSSSEEKLNGKSPSPIRVFQPLSNALRKSHENISESTTIKLSLSASSDRIHTQLRNPEVNSCSPPRLSIKPVVPVRAAPPPPVAKPRVNQPQITKSFSSASVFSYKTEPPKVVRSISDCHEENVNTTRNVVYQSNLSKSNSIKRVESIKNEKNNEEKYSSNAEIKLSIDKSEIIQTNNEKTTITVSSTDDANNNTFSNQKLSESSDSSILTVDSKNSTMESKKVKFDDKLNHEILIQELENMRKEQERLSKRQRKPFKDIYDTDETNSRISHSDWVELDNGEEIRLSSCQIFINEDEFEEDSGFRSPKNMSLHGLPPLPKSLSGFNLMDNGHRDPRFRVPASPGPQTPSRASSSRGPTPPTPGSGTGHVVYPPHPRMNGSTGNRKPTNLDTQLAILRREMYGLRQLDLTLLSQLYSLNEAIQDFRQILQDQEDTAFSPHSPSPSASSGDEVDEFYSPQTIRFKPTPAMRRTSNSSSAGSSEYGTV